MSSLEKQKILYITATMRELLEKQYKLTGKTDPELMAQFVKYCKICYSFER